MDAVLNTHQHHSSCKPKTFPLTPTGSVPGHSCLVSCYSCPWYAAAAAAAASSSLVPDGIQNEGYEGGSHGRLQL